MKEDTMKPELKDYLNLSEAISKLLHPFAEVVLHDLEKNQIEAIFNPFSKREVGDASYLDDFEAGQIDDHQHIIGPYEKLNFDGRKLKSISITIPNANGKVVGFLCINLDVSTFDKVQNILGAFLSNRESSPEDQNLFKNDLYERINQFVQKHCLENNLSLEHLTREQKQSLILKLQEEGALQGKNSAQYIARTIGISRATVYNYLKEGTAL